MKQVYAIIISIIESMDMFWTLNTENKERISEFKTIIENKII